MLGNSPRVLFQAAEGIVRGTKSSHASFNGAFGMVPTKEIISVPKALLAEVFTP